MKSNLLEFNEDEDKLFARMVDEAHFYVSGYVNRQNFRFSNDIKPKQMHPTTSLLHESH